VLFKGIDSAFRRMHYLSVSRKFIERLTAFYLDTYSASFPLVKFPKFVCINTSS